MRKKIISVTLALIYFSVSILFASPHSHDHSKALSHQCAACVWHSESTADVAVGPSLVAAPVFAFLCTPAREVEAVSATPRFVCDRGPPVRS